MRIPKPSFIWYGIVEDSASLVCTLESVDVVEEEVVVESMTVPIDDKTVAVSSAEDDNAGEDEPGEDEPGEHAQTLKRNVKIR